MQKGSARCNGTAPTLQGRTAYLTYLGAVGTSVLLRDGESFIWTLKAREGDNSSDRASDEDMDRFVIGLFESLRIVLPSGRFESAVVFSLDDGGRVATINKDQFEDADKDTEVVLSVRRSDVKSSR